MLSKSKNIHFIGIGGIGMSGIAQLLLTMGFNITGSDILESESIVTLRKLGIKISVGHKSNNIKSPDLIVYSSAINIDNVEIIEGRNKFIPIIRRAEMLGELLKLKKTSIAVSGTHGKTTTSSMLGAILIEARLNPTLVIGGIVNSFGSNAVSGMGDIIVVEADEFDRSFLSLNPSMNIINNLELDHIDCYKDINETKDAFISFANMLPIYGLSALNIDDKNIQEIINKIKRPYKTFGLNENADICAKNIVYNKFNSIYQLHINQKKSKKIELNVPGKHNIQNSLAAIVIALELNIDINIIKIGLLKYNGVKRRLEITQKTKEGSILIDDYAHHPTEVEASLLAIKNSYKNRIITIFQPHLFSRTLNFYKEFAESLSISDIVVIMDIYPAREKPIKGVTSKLIVDCLKKKGHQNICFDIKIENLTDEIKKMTAKGDIIITMGAGNITKQNEPLKNILL